MGAFKYIRKNEMSALKDSVRRRELLAAVSSAPLITRVEKPMRITRARMLGYKAKSGFIVVRVRVSKGSFRRPRPVHARRPSKTGIYFNLAISKQGIAEQRAGKAYPNMSILGSYLLVENGNYKWFDVIMADPVLVHK